MTGFVNIYKPFARPDERRSVCVPNMDFQARIDHDLKEAMKARETDRLNVIRMLKTALKHASIEQGGAEARLDDLSAIVRAARLTAPRQMARHAQLLERLLEN